MGFILKTTVKVAMYKMFERKLLKVSQFSHSTGSCDKWFKFPKLWIIVVPQILPVVGEPRDSFYFNTKNIWGVLQSTRNFKTLVTSA